MNTGCIWNFGNALWSLFQPIQLQLVVCGPMDSGKSSFVLLIAGSSSSANIDTSRFDANTVPTKNHKNSRAYIDDTSIICLDYGGQNKYQQQLLGTLTSNDNDKVIIFVFDYSEYLIRNTHETPLLILGNKLDIVIDKYESLSEDNGESSSTTAISNSNKQKDSDTSSAFCLNLLSSLLAASSSTDMLLSKQTITNQYRHANNALKKSPPLRVLENISINQLANDLDLFVKDEDDDKLFIRLSHEDFTNDEDFLKLFQQLKLSECNDAARNFKTVENIPKNYSVEICLHDRDFAIMLMSCKTGEGVAESIQWILSHE